MNYPMTQLAIIGPILFVVLLVITPIIGVFGGWKRAAYWGGGNLAVYAAGLISYKVAGTQIFNLLRPIIEDLVKQIMSGKTIPAEQMNALLQSIVGPIFFIAIVLVMNLLLLICYYAFAKRCMRVGKFSAARRVEKMDKKLMKMKEKGNNKNEKYAALVQKRNKWGVKADKYGNSIKNKKWFNRTVGGVGMTLVTLPTIFTSAQAVTMLTTSAATRKNNKFASGVYSFLNTVMSKFTPINYYNATSASKDFDAAFGILGISTQKITYKVFTGNYDSEGNPIFTESTQQKPVIEALGESMSKGMQELIKQNQPSGGVQPTPQSVAKGVNVLGTLWNSVVDQSTDNISALFQSENVTGLLEPVLSEILPTTDKPKIAEEDVSKIFAEGTFQAVVDDYTKLVNGEISTSQYGITTPLHAIPTTQKCVDNITASIKGMISLTPKTEGEPIAEATQKLFDESIAKIVNMLVYAEK